jgi:hypothetical protein
LAACRDYGGELPTLFLFENVPRIMTRLEGCSDAKAREYVRNAAPPDAAEGMANVMLMAMVMSKQENHLFLLIMMYGYFLKGNNLK